MFLFCCPAGGTAFVTTQAISWIIFSATVVMLVVLLQQLVAGVAHCFQCWALGAGTCMVMAQAVSITTWQTGVQQQIVPLSPRPLCGKLGRSQPTTAGPAASLSALYAANRHQPGELLGVVLETVQISTVGTLLNRIVGALLNSGRTTWTTPLTVLCGCCGDAGPLPAHRSPCEAHSKQVCLWHADTTAAPCRAALLPCRCWASPC
jgi:hypothetical protein